MQTLSKKPRKASPSSLSSKVKKIVTMFVFATTKTILVEQKFSKRHQRKIVKFPWYKHSLGESKKPTEESLMKTAFKACFGEDQDNYECLTEGPQFKIGDTNFKVYKIDESMAKILKEKRKCISQHLYSLKNRKNVLIDNEIHRIPKSVQRVLNELKVA